MKPLHLNFKPSKQFFVLYTFMALFMSAIIVSLDISWWGQLFCVGVISAWTSYEIAAKALLKGIRSIVLLEVSAQNKVTITYRDGQQVSDIQVCLDTVATPYLTVMRYRQPHVSILRRLFSKSLIIMPDMLSADEFRSLRVWLRWGLPTQLEIIEADGDE